MVPLVVVTLGAVEGRHTETYALERLTGYVIGVCIVTLAGGIMMIRRGSRWRKMLATQPWRAYQVRYLASKGNKAGDGLVLSSEGQPAGGPTVLRISTVRWRTGRLSSERAVWVCGDPSGEVVVAPPGSGALYAALPPDGYIGRKWQRAHKAELASLGFELHESAHKRRSLVEAIVFSAISASLLFLIFGFVIEIAKDKPTGTAFWITAAIACFLAASTLKRAARGWSTE